MLRAALRITSRMLRELRIKVPLEPLTVIHASVMVGNYTVHHTRWLSKGYLVLFRCVRCSLSSLGRIP